MGPFGSDIKTDNFVDTGVPVVRGGNLTDGFHRRRLVLRVSEAKKRTNFENANAFPHKHCDRHRGTFCSGGSNIPERSRFSSGTSCPKARCSLRRTLTSQRRDTCTTFFRSAIGQHALLPTPARPAYPPSLDRRQASVQFAVVPLPSIQVCAFDSLVQTRSTGVAESAGEESRTLAALRDTLLPKAHLWRPPNRGHGEIRSGDLICTSDETPFDQIGYWSEIKLDIIKEFATAYSRILSRQKTPRLHHVYIDAFAGAGVHISKASGEFVPGSPMNTLLVKPPFREYHFIDLDEQKCQPWRLWPRSEKMFRSTTELQPGSAR